MKDSDLESKLRALAVPERDQEYWDAFPGRVLTKLHDAPKERSAGRDSMFRFEWGFALGLACAVAVFCIGQSRIPKAVSYALLKDEKELRATLGQFPNHVSKLMQDEHGLHRLIEDPQ